MKPMIKVGNLELTMNEAKELYQELHRLFGQQQISPIPVYPIYPSTPANPAYPCYPLYPLPSRWDATCGSINTNASEIIAS